MNNKIRVDTFFKSGGVVEFQLFSDIRAFGEFPIFLFAGSPEGVQEMKVEMCNISDGIYKASGGYIPYSDLVRKVSYSCDGIIYESDFDPKEWMFALTNLDPKKPKYLRAVDKCYPKKF